MIRALALVLMLAGCAAMAPPTTVADHGPKPANIEQAVKSYLRQILFDPESLRDLYIGPAWPASYWGGLLTPNPGWSYGWSVCATLNAKNRFGGYTGQQVYEFMFVGGILRRSLQNPYCAGPA